MKKQVEVMEKILELIDEFDSLICEGECNDCELRKIKTIINFEEIDLCDVFDKLTVRNVDG